MGPTFSSKYTPTNLDANGVRKPMEMFLKHESRGGRNERLYRLNECINNAYICANLRLCACATMHAACAARISIGFHILNYSNIIHETYMSLSSVIYIQYYFLCKVVSCTMHIQPCILFDLESHYYSHAEYVNRAIRNCLKYAIICTVGIRYNVLRGL